MRSSRSAEVAKLEGPLQDDAVLAIGKIGDKRGLAVLAGAAADRAARLSAVDRRSHLPAGQQLRVAPAATWWTRCGSRSRIPATRSSCGRRRRAARARRRRATRTRRGAVRGGAPTRDPRAGAHRPGARHRRAPQHAASCSRCSRQQAHLHPRDRAAARSVRHARRGLRRGAVLRRRPARLLGGAAGSPARNRRRLIQKLSFDPAARVKAVQEPGSSLF